MANPATFVSNLLMIIFISLSLKVQQKSVQVEFFVLNLSMVYVQAQVWAFLNQFISYIKTMARLAGRTIQKGKSSRDSTCDIRAGSCTTDIGERVSDSSIFLLPKTRKKREKKFLAETQKFFFSLHFQWRLLTRAKTSKRDLRIPKRENIFNVNKQRFFTVNVHHIAWVGGSGVKVEKIG